MYKYLYLAYVPRVGDYTVMTPQTLKRGRSKLCTGTAIVGPRRMVGQYLWWGKLVADCGYPHTESDQRWSSCSYVLHRIQGGFYRTILEASIT